MNKTKYIVNIFALAVFIAGFFICLTPSFAYAEQVVKPWNVDVVIEYCGDTFHYDLSEQISDVLCEADARGFYSGYVGKRALADELLASGLPAEAVY